MTHSYRRHAQIWIRMLTVTLSLFCVLLIQTAPAYAAASTGSTPSAPDVLVGKGDVMHDLLVIGKHVEIRGDIQDNFVAINSTVYIEPGAHVDTLLAIGGQVVRDPGSTVKTALLFTPTSGILNQLAPGIAFVSLLTILKFVASVGLIFFSVIFSVLFKPWLERPLTLLRGSLRRRFVVGFLASLAVCAATFGFAITRIGIPVALLIIVAYTIVGLIGIAAISVLIGRTILHPYRETWPTWLLSLFGAVLIVACANIPIVGLLLFAIAWCIGTSTVLGSVRGAGRSPMKH